MGIRGRLEAEIRRIANHARLVDPVIFGDPDRVIIGSDVTVNNALLNTVAGTITIEDTAFFGHNVAILTGTHDHRQLGLERQAASPSSGRDVTIGAGAWITSNVTIIGPCRIGRDAVVAVGAVVVDDVPDGAIVAGVPGRQIGSVY